MLKIWESGYDKAATLNSEKNGSKKKFCTKTQEHFYFPTAIICMQQNQLS